MYEATDNVTLPCGSLLDPDYGGPYNGPPGYGYPGYTDYDYGDYNEGVGLYPPKKLSVSSRVAKWFSGFKIPASKVRASILMVTSIILVI